MASDRSSADRPVRRRPEIERPPAVRRGRGERIVRWIGAAKRRAAKLAGEDSAEHRLAEVVYLAFADTFGRPSRRDAALSPPSGAVILLWPSRP